MGGLTVPAVMPLSATVLVWGVSALPPPSRQPCLCRVLQACLGGAVLGEALPRQGTPGCQWVPLGVVPLSPSEALLQQHLPRQEQTRRPGGGQALLSLHTPRVWGLPPLCWPARQRAAAAYSLRGPHSQPGRVAASTRASVQISAEVGRLFQWPLCVFSHWC